MSSLPTPTTELQAVNIMLSIIGESPVNSLDDKQIVDAVLARDILSEVMREVQSEGWHFNTEIDYPLSPNMTGEIRLPKNCIQFDLDPKRYPDLDVVQRGERLYDRVSRSYKFERAIYGQMTILLPFNEMPEPARRYCLIKAGRIFQDRVIGSETLNGFNKQDEARARAILVGNESENDDLNVLTDSWGVARTLWR